MNYISLSVIASIFTSYGKHHTHSYGTIKQTAKHKLLNVGDFNLGVATQIEVARDDYSVAHIKFSSSLGVGADHRSTMA